MAQEKKVVKKNVSGSAKSVSAKSNVKSKSNIDSVIKSKTSQPTKKLANVRQLADGSYVKKCKVKTKDGKVVVKELHCDKNGVLLKTKKVSKSEYQQTVDKKTFNREEFLKRVNSRHSFLNNLDEGKTASQSSSIQVKNGEKEIVAPDNSAYVKTVEPSTDKSVEMLQSAVNSAQLKNMTGRGSTKAVPNSSSDISVTSVASNPNEAKTNSPISNANNPISKNLTGSFVNKESLDAVILPVAVRKVKAKKHIQPWKICLIVTSIVLAGFLGVFFGFYNFGSKSVNIVTYEVCVGKNATVKYYDGELLSFSNITFNYLKNGKDLQANALKVVDNIDKIAENSGFYISNGYISVDWSGEFANRDSRVVKVPIIDGGFKDVLSVTVYRNKLVGMTKFFTIPSLASGTIIYPTIFGVYKNTEILGDDTFETQLDPSLYTIFANIGTIESPNWINLKTMSGRYDSVNNSYTLPYSVVQLKARFMGSYFTPNSGEFVELLFS